MEGMFSSFFRLDYLGGCVAHQYEVWRTTADINEVTATNAAPLIKLFWHTSKIETLEFVVTRYRPLKKRFLRASQSTGCCTSIYLTSLNGALLALS